MTNYGASVLFENKSRPRVLAGKDGWVHRWSMGSLLMIPVTDFLPHELWGVRWVWVRHDCHPYRTARELAARTGQTAADRKFIVARELAEIERRREREACAAAAPGSAGRCSSTPAP